MKASLKFRDDRQPLVTAKIPVSVLGFPFLSGISAGDAKELRLDLATAFESGPSFRVSYRPNDSWRPFSFLVKIGVGSLGSPSAAPMTMAAEFGLFAGRSPSFTIQIKPRLGDFFIRKSSNSAAGDGNGFIIDGGSSWNKPVNGIPIAVGIGDLFSGAELMSQSVLPLRSQAAVKFRWGVRMPPETRSAFVQDLQRKDPAGGAALRRLPVLVMSKVSVEQVLPPAAPASPATKPGDLAVSVQSQLAALQGETGMLRKAMEELRVEFGARSDGGGGRNAGRASLPPKNGRTYEGGGASAGGGGGASKKDVNEELRKALMKAAAGDPA
ncbi:unnamed protein product [Spirodela intermedia]|uniref:Uncharacterized protein n=1 Tax=Spirodela intermedia TaxID=51605 RepID=A0A7I8KJP9_SPIIN|nr:unnamed protein product [Spirodela intermedia]